MRHETCCFTGHRDLPEGARPFLRRRLETALERLIAEGVRYFGAGGALGFDTLAEECVLRLRERHPHIRLILVLPCPEQTRGWPPQDVNIYHHILSQADKVVYTADHYFRGCMQQRNRHLVDHSGHCVCYLTRQTGGTAYTVRYAQQKGLAVCNLALPADAAASAATTATAPVIPPAAASIAMPTATSVITPVIAPATTSATAPADGLPAAPAAPPAQPAAPPFGRTG